MPTLTIITLTGCKDTLLMALPDSIRFEPAAIARFVVDSQRVSIFAPTINLFDLSSGGISVSLSTGDGTLYGAGNLQHTYSDTGVYSVVQRIESAVGCVDSLVQDVYVYPEIRLWIPNAFSPNDDGRNERFLPVVLGAKTYSLLIKDRWGETVFASEQTNDGWDGTFKGQDCPQGGYAYNLTLYTVKGKTYERKGMIHLLR
jgi:gliding motility-associated-like protein